MKLNKTQNRICLGLAIGALVAIFFYQVAHATSESSYRFGFKYGKEEWQWTTEEGCDANNGQASCTNTWNGAAMGAVTNITAMSMLGIRYGIHITQRLHLIQKPLYALPIGILKVLVTDGQLTLQEH
jgi:CDP-diglyceride synthetase